MSETPIWTELTAADVRELCGDILDWKIAAILALQPCRADVAAAAGRGAGEDDLDHLGRPLDGVAAQVFDVLGADDYHDER